VLVFFLGGGCLRRKKSLLFRDEQKLRRKSHFIPSYVASFFSFNLSYILKKTNFGLVTRHIFTINTITKAGRVFNTWRDMRKTKQYSCCAQFGKTPSNQSTHQSGCKKQRRSLHNAPFRNPLVVSLSSESVFRPQVYRCKLCDYARRLVLRCWDRRAYSLVLHVVKGGVECMIGGLDRPPSSPYLACSHRRARGS
jgi:hypothetical protein